jgi:hypothetical protein
LTKIIALGVTLTVTFLTHSASAQERRIDVTGYGGIGFTGDLSVGDGVTAGSVDVDDAPVYGGLIGFRTQPSGFVYFSYSRMETTAYFRPSGGFETSGQADVSFEYFQLGGNLEAHRGRLVPYLGLSLGATRVAALEASGSDYSFSAVLDGGLKVMLADFLFVRAIGRMPVSFVTGESASLCASGLGCAFVYSGQPLLQGQLLLGAGLLL